VYTYSLFGLYVRNEIRIRIPVVDMEDDENIARRVYDDFDFGQHTVEETKTFETTHLATPAKNTQKKKREPMRNVRIATGKSGDELGYYPSRDSIHVELPKDSGRITKSSVSYLYAAIVCLILRDISHFIPPHPINREYAKAIYTYFSIYEYDLRRTYNWQTWPRIFLDVEKYGYHGAASLNAKPGLSCKNCRNDREKQRLQQINSIKFICPKCGGTEAIIIYLKVLVIN
jgi:hypothetical protein